MVKIYINVKALAKRRPIIEKHPLEILGDIKTTNDLIKYMVRENVKEYNEKPVATPILAYLTKEDMADGASLGKIGFNTRQNKNIQNEDAAVENALLSFEDGIFKLFINESEFGFEEEISLKEDDQVTFIRLVMLTGRLW